MSKKQIIKLLVLIGFVAAFALTWMYLYGTVVKKNSFKAEQFDYAK